MMIRDMRTFWKIFAALALMLPLTAFVAGTLVASAADDNPAPRDTLIVDDQSGTPASDPTLNPATASAGNGHDSGDDHGGEGANGNGGSGGMAGNGDGGDDGGLDEVAPTPDDWAGDDHGGSGGSHDSSGPDSSGPDSSDDGSGSGSSRGSRAADCTRRR